MTRFILRLFLVSIQEFNVLNIPILKFRTTHLSEQYCGFQLDLIRLKFTNKKFKYKPIMVFCLCDNTMMNINCAVSHNSSNDNNHNNNGFINNKDGKSEAICDNTSNEKTV
ncbi:unnamed protein product [Trichobilharzia regenti]|nr:unnamed protein product [Trichobilharzia regenti]